MPNANKHMRTYISRGSRSNVKSSYSNCRRGGGAHRRRPCSSRVGTIGASGHTGLARLLSRGECHGTSTSRLGQIAVDVTLVQSFNLKYDVAAFGMTLQERPPHQRALTLFRQRVVAKLHLKLYSADNLVGRSAPECVSQAAGVGAHALLKLVGVQMTRHVGDSEKCTGRLQAHGGGTGGGGASRRCWRSDSDIEAMRRGRRWH